MAPDDVSSWEATDLAPNGHEPEGAPPARKGSLTASAFAARLHGGLLLLTVFVAALVGVLLVQSRAQYEERTVASGRNLSHLLTQELDAWFDKVDLAVVAVKGEAERFGTRSTGGAPALDDFIQGQLSRQPELDALRVSDAAGHLRAGTGVSSERPVNIASRAFFRKLAADPATGLVVSEPILGQISGKWSIVFARRITGADGSFQGVAFAVIFIERLTAKFAALDLGTHGAVSLRSLDLGTVARHPEPPKVPSTGNPTFSKEWAELVRRQPLAGTYSAVGLDGRKRALAYTRVTEYPFFVIVGLDPEDYLSPWRQEAFRLVAAVVAFLMIALLLSRMLSKTWREREAVTAALLASKAQALARSEDRLQSALQAAEMGVWIFHPKDESSSASARATTMMGVTTDSPSDLDALLEHVAGADRDRVLEAVQAALRAEPTDLVVQVALALGEVRWIAWAVRWMPGGAGHPQSVIALMRDVTAEKEIALQQQRKDEFLAMLSHELRGPLAPIRTSFELMRMSNDPQVIDRSAGVLDRQLKQLSTLVDDLLDLSRVTQGKLRLRTAQVDLRHVIQHAVESSRPLLDTRAHRLTVMTPDEAVVVEADHGRLVQVFSNLLNNAAKYTSVGGHVAVTLLALDGVAEVTVADDGEGIAADMLPHIFEMFAQGTSPHGRGFDGLGVGLGVVKRLVELHGGSVTASSDGPGCGSSFKVVLPRVAVGAASPVQFPGRIESSANASSAKVLVVDDDEDARQSLALLVEGLGHQVAVARDGAAGLKLAAATKPDIVLLDLSMPGMDGFEVASRLRSLKELEGVVIVALTGWDYEQESSRAQQAGIDHHVTKPVSLARLQSLIEACVKAKRHGGADAYLQTTRRPQ